MRLEYFPAHSLDDLVSLVDSKVRSDDGNEYVEGIMYGRDEGVIVVGNMVNDDDSADVVSWNDKIKSTSCWNNSSLLSLQNYF